MQVRQTARRPNIVNQTDKDTDRQMLQHKSWRQTDRQT
jgi:hypothetical protein